MKARNEVLTAEQILEIVAVFKEWSFLDRSHKRQLLDQLVPEIFVYRYDIRGLTLRISSNTYNPLKKAKSPLAGQHAL